MTRRRLTEAEKRLWRLATRDVKRLSDCRKEDPLEKDPLKKDSGGSDPDAASVPRPRRPKQIPQIRPRSQAAGSPRFGSYPVDAVPSLPDHTRPDHNWQQKLRRGKVAIEGKIDLHGMTQERAFQALRTYIERAQAQGKRVILVVTGKGGPKQDLEGYALRDFDRRRGILREQVPKWLASGELRQRIISWYTAGRQHGGEGALYVVLKRRRG
ncbi:Smr/MutS family protein [Luteithermobacter gelatinilyticus]|uniref:Smr/MutS family protein n=1 Tax=Luteithermobacter gelatinilyticus TaxID=2582913 RepID=UPI00143DE85A|nr:Smr/MutS family protein [Luteithermobacter gelatinilyticus]